MRLFIALHMKKNTKRIFNWKRNKSIKKRPKINRKTVFEFSNTVIGLFIGIVGLYLGCQANKMNKRMLNISEKQDSTSLDLIHFNTLLDKTAIILSKDSQLVELSRGQIDSLVKLTGKTATVADVVTDQYNITAFHSNLENQKELTETMNAYNNVIYQFSEMAPILTYHRLQKEGRIAMRNKDIQERVKALESIQGHLQKLGNLADLIPNKGMAELYSDCLTDIIRLRLFYLEGLALGYKTDTTMNGQEVYSGIMGNVIILEDTVLHCLESERASLFDEIAKGDKRIKNFAKSINERQRKLKVEGQSK